jgi:hypothetical protein
VQDRVGDGSPYFAVGENTGRYDQRGTYVYDDASDIS